MGEYAHDAMRREIKDRHGFDIGDCEDEPKRSHAKPVYKRVKCPHCNATPKKKGLWQHIRDVHGINQVEQVLTSKEPNK